MPAEAVTPRPEGTLTFARDVAPLVHANCVPCHRPGGAGPFPLITHDDVRKRARQVVKVTRSRFMPPWMVPPGYGSFLGERRLTADQIALLARWVAEGAPLGDPADVPEPPRFAEGWELGTPDVVVELPEPYELRAGGGDVFRNFVIPDVVDELRYVRGLEFHPVIPEVIHHAEVRIDETRNSLLRDLADPEPGFDGMETETARQAPGHFLGWVPGRTPRLESPETAWPLAPETDLVVELHLQPSGKPEMVQARIGLYLSDEPPTRVPLIVRLGSEAIDIPAGEPEYWIEDSFELPVPVTLESCWPHAHFLGRDLQAFVVMPDGSKRWLIRIPDWDFNWQDQYWFDPPLRLPAGATIVMRYSYDNSPDNVNNPRTTPERVVFGGRSIDEMGDLWLRVQTDGPDERRVLQRANQAASREIRRAGVLARLDRDPDDPVSIASLGFLLLQEGRLDEARGRFERAVAIDPGYVLAHGNLGVTLCRAGRLREGIAPLRRALELDPGYRRARLNLAEAHRALGELDEAATEYRAALALRPADARTHVALANALEAAGRPEEALDPLREAARLEPGWAEPRAAAAWILATAPGSVAPQPHDAMRLAQEAVRLTERRSASALRSLAAARAALGDHASAGEIVGEALALPTAGGTLRTLLSEELELYRTGRTRSDETR